MALSDKRVLVTGVCGTVGKELVRQLLEERKVKELFALDNNESELFFLEHGFSRFKQASFYLADVRDRDKLNHKMNGIDVVFHTAAFKHVLLCERSPFEAVQTNIIGVQNVITAARDNEVERIVFTSSDKAVNPTSVMGTSKLMGERLMTAANSDFVRGGPIFVSTRFGNVLGSSGSVVPVFRGQIRRGGPVTLTDPAMTRFIMTLADAVRLVIESGEIAQGGEVFIAKMPTIRIEDLAEVMIQELAPTFGHRPADIQIEITGPQPGEKMYEELLSFEETRRTWELKNYFVILPAFTTLYEDIDYYYPDIISRNVATPYQSQQEKPLSKKQLANFLHDNNLFQRDRGIDQY